ncbi:hypothetical protein PBAL39_19869 [Pedobacter sp. BAL39]|nr:hypothetical protein PBAL39_19869 [Pedobacter sp. BAL39]
MDKINFLIEFQCIPVIFKKNVFKNENYIYLRTVINAKVAQLVEHDLAKVGVASSNLVFRSKKTFIIR